MNCKIAARQRAIMGILAPARVAVALLAAAAGPVQAQSAAPDAIRDPLSLQQARHDRVAARGTKAFYTNQWDLSGLPPYVPDVKVSGKLRIWGLNYIGDSGLSKVWAEGFRKFHPDATIEYNLPTALIAIPGLVCGVADLAASRPITFDERELFQRIFNCEPVEIKMVTGSYNVPGYATTMAVIVNKDNPISRLSLRQLDGIFGAERTGAYQGIAWHPELARSAAENIRAWGQLGLTGEWRDQPINLYSATLRFHYPPVFEQIVFKGGTKWNERLREYNNYLKADGTGWYSHGEQVPDEVSRDRYGIGLTWIAYLTPRSNAKAVALAAREGGPYAELTIENVQNRTYPLAYNEYWYFYRKPGAPIDPKVREFVRYVLSREGQEAVTRSGKFLPLTAEVVREEMRKLD